MKRYFFSLLTLLGVTAEKGNASGAILERATIEIVYWVTAKARNCYLMFQSDR